MPNSADRTATSRRTELRAREGCIRVTKTSNSAKPCYTIRAAPADAFTAFTKVNHTLATGNGAVIGIVIADGTAAASGNQWTGWLGITTVVGTSD